MFARIDEYQKLYHWIAYVYAVLGCLTMLGMQMSMKILTQTFSPFYVVCTRGAILFIVNTFALNAQQLSLNQKNYLTFNLLMKRSILSATTFLLLICPIKYNSISLTNCLFNLSPIFIHFQQNIFFKKPLNRKHLFLTVLCFIGVLMIMKPSFLFGQSDNDDLSYYLLFPLIAAFTYGLASIYMHNLKGKVHSMVAVHHFYILQIVISGLFMNSSTEIVLQESQYLGYRCWLCWIGLVVFGYLTQNLSARSLFLKKPSIIMPFWYINTVIGFVIDVVYFGDSFDWMSILGMMLTSSGLLMKLLISQ